MGTINDYTKKENSSTTQLTGSYLITDAIFYGLALFFFGCYFLLTRKTK